MQNSSSGVSKTHEAEQSQPSTKPPPVGQLLDGVLGNFVTMSAFAASELIQNHPRDAVLAVREMVKTVQAGDLSQPEAILMVQSLTLDAIFGSLGQRAAKAVSSDLERGERLLRLALKAQAQSRATLETLINAKNPPVVFARQANIASGHQQVNNGPLAGHAGKRSNGSGGRAENFESAPIELLEECQANGERMDAGASAEAGRCDQGMEALGQVDGTTHSRGQGPKRPQRRPRRAQTSHA